MYKIIGGDGQEYGPIGEVQLREWIAQGRANGDTQVRRDGETEWTALQAVPEFAAALSGTVAVGAVPAPAAMPVAVNIPNYLVQSILVTLCCCLPLGIPAIVFAAQVNTKIAAGDYAGAQESSRKAKKWCWIGVGVGAGVQLIYLIVYGVILATQFGGIN